MKPNQVDDVFWRTIAKSIFETEFVTAISTGIDKAALNPVIRTDSSSAKAEQIIGAVSEFYAKEGVPWCWCLDGRGEGRAFGAKLEKAGFVFIEAAPQMALSLDNLPPLNIDIEIKEVLSKRDFADWAIPVNSGFRDDDNSFAELLSNIPCGPTHTLRHFVAYEANRPVSACTTTIISADCRIDNMATVLEDQRRGFGAAMLFYALHTLREAGCKYCFLDASEEGFGLYQKTGFKTIGELLIYEPS